MGQISVNGRLPVEVIQRIVRQSFGHVQICYQDGLRSNPTLQGRVATKFVIGSDGSVSGVQDGGSDLPDQVTTKCVIDGFKKLLFPQPEGGVVTVLLPLIFTPGE